MSLLLASVSAAQGFDPELATRAYLDTLQGAARARSDSYFEGGYWVPLWGAVVSVAAYWLMLHFGWSAAWSGWTQRITKHRWLQPALYSLPFTLAAALLTLPWTIYVDFVREHQYRLSNQSFGEWFAEWGITLGVGIVTGAVFFAIIYAVIRNSPKRWWLWGTVATGALLAVLILLAPVFIEPLLNKYTPMEHGEVRTEILRIAHDQGIPANDVYVVDASKQSRRISANVSGLGPTIRIALNDNLLNRSNLAGIKAVMGHEMGHYKLNHIQKLLLYLSLMALAAFLITYWAVPKLLARYGGRWGVRDIADPASAPAIWAVLAILTVPGGLIFNSVIRHHEIEADAFGLEAAREPDGFAMTAMQLSEYRKIEPSPLEEVIFYDHPSGRARVRMAMEWKARHLDELPPVQRGIIVMTAENKAD